MTTASIAWETAFAPGFDGVVVALVEGIPRVLTPSGVHPTTVAVTSGTIDPLFWPGTGTLTVTRPDGVSTFDPVLEALDSAAVWTIRETTLLAEGSVQVEPLRFDLFDADESATALLSAPLSRAARLLAADIDATDDIPLDSVAGVPSSGYLHIGREAVGYGALSGTTALIGYVNGGRGMFGSRARAFVAGTGTRRPLVIVGDSPRYWTGRRVAVFLCKLVGTTLYDPTLVHLGIVGAGVSLAANLMRWQIPADHITALLSRKFSKVAVRAFGYQHVGGWIAATLSVNFENTLELGPEDPITDPSPGWSPDAQTFISRLNRKGSLLSPQINVSINGTGNARIVATGSGGDITWTINACWNNPTQRTGSTPNLGENTALPLPACVMHLDGVFAVRRAGDWDLIPATLAWTAAVGTQTGRAYAALVADTDNAKGLFARIVSRDAATQTLLLNADVPGLSESYDGTQPIAREAASRITKPTDCILGVMAQGDTALAALRAMGAALDSLQGTDASEVAIDWDQMARTFARVAMGRVPEGRSYRFAAADDSLLTPLIHECRLRGAALCIVGGRLGAYRPAYFAATEETRRDIYEEDLLPGLPVEVTDGIEPTASAIRFAMPDGSSYTWRDATSAEEFGEGKTIECDALKSATGAFDPAQFQEALAASAQQLLGVLSAPTRIVRIVVGPSFWDLSTGDLVSFTHSSVPNLQGTRGLDAVTCQVMESRKSFNGGECRVQLALLMSNDPALAGYAPSALVGSIAGAVVTIDTTSPWGSNGFALDVDVDGNAITGQPLQGFAAGDKVYLSELNNETPMADESFTILSLTATTVTLDSNPSAPMVTAASSRYGCLLRFAPWTVSTVTARQREFLYIADASAEDLGAGDAPKRWAA
jgi:hypothetical protein